MKTRTKKCRNCKEPFTPMRSTLEKYCTKPECIRVWIEVEKAKQWIKSKKEKKAELMSVSDWLKITQATFNKFIRMRDKGLNCISCGKPPKKINAGHYYSSGGHSNVRFDEENCNVQCEFCNTSLSGNLLNYREGLISKIGESRLEALKTRSNEVRRFTIEELKELNELYKQKIKSIEK